MIWSACRDAWAPQPICTSGWRLVELQATSSTRVLVSSLAAHERLEKLLDKEKPAIQLLPHEAECSQLHYLLLTPFRYPPLPFGSRFGTIHERGIFYASSDIKTAATEKAFYRMFLAQGTSGNIGGKNLTYTSFQVKIKTTVGLDLTQGCFSPFQEHISSKITYNESQALGAQIRHAGIHAFMSYSARTTTLNKNLNVLSPLAFDSSHVIQKTFEDWVCFYTKERVELCMKKDPLSTTLEFKEEDFWINGRFPHPPV